MTRTAPPVPKLPPPTAAQCWRTFAMWVLGLPLLVAAALGFVWFAFWATGSMGMSWQLESNTMTVLFWLAVIALLYPAMLWVWWGDLREGLKAAREWEAMTPEARSAALAEASAAARAAAAAKRARPARRARKRG
jgi:hypothetical protein